MNVQPTAEQIAAVEPATGKVYVFVEPTPELIERFGCQPDEHQGAHCCSFTLSEERVQSAMDLTKLAVEAHQQ